MMESPKLFSPDGFKELQFIPDVMPGMSFRIGCDEDEAGCQLVFETTRETENRFGRLTMTIKARREEKRLCGWYLSRRSARRNGRNNETAHPQRSLKKFVCK
jgi:hypothetical protein